MAAASASLLASGTASAEEPTPFSQAGSCKQAGVAVMVDTARLAKYVPAGFPIAGLLGRSPLIVTGGRCKGTVNGEPARANRWGLVLVPSSHPDDPSSLGANAYDLWWLNSERGTATGFRGLGIRSERVRGAVFAREGSTMSYDALSASRFPFAVEVQEVSGPAPGFDLQTFHWHIGRYGRVLVDPQHTALTLDPGIGRVVAPEGSPLAEILGATEVTAPGAILRFDYTGDYAAG